MKAVLSTGALRTCSSCGIFLSTIRIVRMVRWRNGQVV